MTPPCEGCITYAICRSRFERTLVDYSQNFGTTHSVWFAYSDIVRYVDCEIAQLYMGRVLNGLVDTELVLRQEAVVDEILKIFDIPRL